MKFVIYNKEKDEYFRASVPGWTKKKAEATKYKSRQTAEDELRNRKQFFSIVTVELTIVEYNTQAEIEENGEELFNQILSAATELGKCSNNIAGINRYFNETLSEYDKMQEDILHKIEFTPQVGITSLRLMKQLREVRIKRREIKDAIALLAVMSDTNIIGKIQAYEYLLENRTYKPRVLKELFEEDGK